MDPSECDADCSLDDAAAREVLRNRAGIITQKVNFRSLKAYLWQYKCVTMEELRTQFPDEAPDSENNFKLIEIISRRGVGAFNGFLKALSEHAAFEPGERAHKELYDTLNAEANIVLSLSKRRRPSGSSYKSQTSRASLRAGLLGESMETSTLKPPHESEEDMQPISKGEDVDEALKDMPQPPNSIEMHTIDTTHEQPNTDAEVAPQEEETDLGGGGGGGGGGGSGGSATNTNSNPTPALEAPTSSIPHFTKFIWICSVVICFFSPVFFVAGIILLVLSILGFANELKCDEVGFPQSLNLFNFFYGLLCLCAPTFLCMLGIYFLVEDRKTKFEKKFYSTRCLVWMNIMVFLISFVLTITELLYSLFYVAPEVYGSVSSWNETKCDKEIFFTSASIMGISYIVVFLLLIVLGVFLAKLYFRWITDKADPGYLRYLMSACYPRSRYNRAHMYTPQTA